MHHRVEVSIEVNAPAPPTPPAECKACVYGDDGPHKDGQQTPKTSRRHIDFPAVLVSASVSVSGTSGRSHGHSAAHLRHVRGHCVLEQKEQRREQDVCSEGHEWAVQQQRQHTHGRHLRAELRNIVTVTVTVTVAAAFINTTTVITLLVAVVIIC